MKKKFSLLLVFLSSVGLFAATTEASAADMLRVYNPNSGEHFYTAVTNERDHLIRTGWMNEGIGWNAPSSGDNVYRLYNANAGDHHYTLDAGERDHLISVGWEYEGIGWFSDKNQGEPLYRLYNPNAQSGAHHYTRSGYERDSLVNQGWVAEGIGWYGIDSNNSNQSQDINSRFLTLINDYRTSQGANTLTNDSLLNQAADIRSKEITNSFSHTRPDGQSFSSVLADVNFDNYSVAGENLVLFTAGGSSQEIAQRAFDLWKNSPGHNRNMLDPDYTMIGSSFRIVGNEVYGANLFAG